MRRGQIPMYPYSYIFYWAESESKLNFCLKIVVLRSRRVVLRGSAPRTVSRTTVKLQLSSKEPKITELYFLTKITQKFHEIITSDSLTLTLQSKSITLLILFLYLTAKALQ